MNRHERFAMTHAFPKSLFHGDKYVLYGLGNSGTSAVKALLAMGAEIFAWDDSASFDAAKWKENLYLPQDLLSRLHLEPVSEIPQGANALILSPGIPHDLPAPHPVATLARQKNIPILCDVEIFYRAVRKSGSKARFIGITGTNGKSTCTALLAHLLSADNQEVSAGGNIGKAVFSLPLFSDKGIYVLELSSYMLDRIEDFQPEIVIWTTLSPDHLDRHGTFDAYQKAKRNIFKNMPVSGLALFGEKKPWSLEEASLLEKRHINCKWAQDFKPEALPSAPQLSGPHNQDNLALCVIAAQHLGLPDALIAQGAASFHSLPHRMKFLGKINTVSFVNDSKATNFEAAFPALNAYQNIFWLAGGIAKANGIEGIGKLRSHLRRAFLFGRDARRFAQTLREENIPFILCENLKEATEKAFKEAQNFGESVVLLSPACASQDQFQNFEARGELFEALFSTFSKNTDSAAEKA